jgi:hypothetical protein
MHDPSRICFMLKYFVPLFRCSARNVSDWLFTAKFDQKSFARLHAIQGQTGSDECHWADFGCNIQLTGDILHRRHDLIFFGMT